MKNKILAGLLYLLGICTALVGAEDIVGFWKTPNDKTGKPGGVVAIYKHGDRYYGRMIGSYDSEGQMDDTIYDPKTRAPGIIGNPYYSGMDFVWGLRKKDSKYKGKIIDPRKGKIYTAEVWRKGKNLIVRGEIWVFGRNIVWTPAVESDFPRGFKMPDVSKFVPVKPEVD
jgi:uncharacterized protein (DUF2147 family)